MTQDTTLTSPTPSQRPARQLDAINRLLAALDVALAADITMWTHLDGDHPDDAQLLATEAELYTAMLTARYQITQARDTSPTPTPTNEPVGS